MNHRLVLLVPTLAAAITVAACSAAGNPPPTASSQSAPPSAASSVSHAAPPANSTSVAGSSAPASKAMITIKDFDYTVPATVTPGQKITVRNNDDVAHTVTADASKSLFDVNVPPSGTTTLTVPENAGSYPFHCTYHANMHGTLTVR